MRRVERDRKRGKKIVNMLEDLRNGTVIVEGKHDVEKLRLLGIESRTCDSVLRGASLPPCNKTVFIVMDDDKGGVEKCAKLMSVLESCDSFHVDESLGKHMLRRLNVTCVEQICKPIRLALGSAEGRKENGKNHTRPM
jgi:5S rRNA maturation endonuclease (ribonuclease M5)